MNSLCQYTKNYSIQNRQSSGLIVPNANFPKLSNFITNINHKQFTKPNQYSIHHDFTILILIFSKEKINNWDRAYCVHNIHGPMLEQFYNNEGIVVMLHGRVNLCGDFFKSVCACMERMEVKL